MMFFYLIAAAALLVSAIVNIQKTKQAVRIAWMRLVKIHRSLLTLIIVTAVALSFISDNLILTILGEGNPLRGVIFASLIGSISIMPGFVAFPLAGLLLDKGVTFMVLSAFTTTLMMVGVVTFPLEQAHFGTRFSLLRNLISFCIALCVALITGIVFGEVGL